jgi:type III pantothenate kinase
LAAIGLDNKIQAMLLAIDIGNTNVTLGLWDGDRWRHQWRLRTVHQKTADEYGLAVRNLLREFDLIGAIHQVVMASVVPPLTATFEAACRRYLELTPLPVRSDSQRAIVVKVDHPAEVGADRIANAVAAFHFYPGPSVVVDMGSATTFDAVSSAGELLGVAIAPGIQLAHDALASRTAQLSRVALAAPPAAIGRNTVTAMQSGLVFGYVGLVEGLVGRLAGEIMKLEAAEGRPERPVRVIGTGGLIHIIAPHTPLLDHVDPWLTLDGIRLIGERFHTTIGSGA